MDVGKNYFRTDNCGPWGHVIVWTARSASADTLIRLHALRAFTFISALVSDRRKSDQESWWGPKCLWTATGTSSWWITKRAASSSSSQTGKWSPGLVAEPMGTGSLQVHSMVICKPLLCFFCSQLHDVGACWRPPHPQCVCQLWERHWGWE